MLNHQVVRSKMITMAHELTACLHAYARVSAYIRSEEKSIRTPTKFVPLVDAGL